MPVKLRRPILVGGVGLSFLLWLLQSIHEEVVELGELGVLGLVVVGSWFWLFGSRKPKEIEFTPVPSTLDRETVTTAIAKSESLINHLESETEDKQIVTQLREQLAQLLTELDRQEIKLAITGGKSCGKTALRQLLASNWLPQQQQSLSLTETPALFESNDADLDAQAKVEQVTNSSDLVLFVTAGDLTDTELQILQQLAAAKQRILLILNKQDQYLPTAQVLILQQLRQRVGEILTAEDVISVASSPVPVKVRQHQADGSVKEWMEPQQPDLEVLTHHLSQIIAQEGQQLIWASTIRAAVVLGTSAQTALNQVRRHHSLPVIEQYQWIAAAAAFANPVPALDLLATAAISSQLVIELGSIYQQKFSLSQAQAAAKTLGSLMVKLGLVELSTQAIGTILKTNTFTYVAGGTLQGVSAAYLTRLAGLSLIEYFQEQEYSEEAAAGQPLNFDSIRQKLQTVFQQNQRTAILQTFVKKAVGYIMPESSQTQLSSSETKA
ncbi:MAG: DUF697 domain-containing protein [Symploca sp. SIO1C4]|uniref:DUF697 domain-containing protein n=1 Tax=Symploca sp. SIO1C4 TaxID=2607765 RepID=A0A6B3N9F7_9CYAN|nr:DUF697 domain-containing protein [Symploca sp. SIO1C4]